MGSFQYFKRTGKTGRTPGKIEASLNKKLNEVEWGEYKLGDLFEIKRTLSFNTDRLTNGTDFDYVTRTSFNQGILQKTGFINEENINEANIWSLGLLQMDFFYRKNPWYAGQFVRKVIPKINIPKNAVLYFSALLNKQKTKLLSVLVRNVDKVFCETTVKLPITYDKKINFDFMEKFIAELEAERIAELEAYLVATGLKDYELTKEEKEALRQGDCDNVEWGEFNVIDMFDVKNTNNILSRNITQNSGKTPYLCAGAENNSVSSYIAYNDDYLDDGNCIFIGGKTFVVTYQNKDFYSNDSHNLALYLKDKKERNKLNQLYLVTCIKKSLGHKYFWGDSISNKKIQKDKIFIPIKNNKIDYEFMETYISAVQKLVIKDVVLYADRKIKATKEVIRRN